MITMTCWILWIPSSDTGVVVVGLDVGLEVGLEVGAGATAAGPQAASVAVTADSRAIRRLKNLFMLSSLSTPP